ncbi:hypothetical protein BLNAU_16255 [Blattamonas nauphoetae]|uniref:Uncharacterized protein n=1 Tax=Blattamonas nauphoetae TaxID=2049346 RepID=A0ABQ9XF17_9EUKA|nr:hypothetical protein BLNAU_16255 [Blattamonas nauphoetae]
MEVIEASTSKSTDQASSNEAELFSLTRRCGFALARIEQGVLALGQSHGGNNPDTQTRNIQQQVGGMSIRHFRSFVHSSVKEIGEIGIDLTAVRREMEDKMRQMGAEREKEKEEMETERDQARKAEEERQREFARKMREIEEMKRMNEKWIEEGRQQEEKEKEKKRRREQQRKRKKEEEEQKEKEKARKEGAAAIEVFQQDKFTVYGNVFTKSVNDWSSFFSLSFGPVVVRIAVVIRNCVNSTFAVGLIATDMIEQATQTQGSFSNLKRAAGWVIHPSLRWVRQNGKDSHHQSTCKSLTVGQRLVMEVDGRKGIRTLKLSQDGETHSAFFSNIPVPFRFAIQMYESGASVEIVSTEVLREASIVGGKSKVVMD